jgi:hypothetical protein
MSSRRTGTAIEGRGAGREKRRLEFELGAWFEGFCGFALVLALSQKREHGEAEAERLLARGLAALGLAKVQLAETRE